MFLDKIKLEAHETVLSQTRRHWFVIVTQLLGPVIGAFVPPILALVFLNMSTTTVVADAVAPYALYFGVFYCLWLIFLWMAIFNIWTNYYLDIITVTNERIILVDQKGLFHRNIGSFRLERLQDLNVDINGIFATLLDYGTLHAETAGHGEEEFSAFGIPHPRELKATILEASDYLMESAPPLSVPSPSDEQTSGATPQTQ
jgi:uncharacterized membrane protein YdbT with pleckstrin-like domain